MSITAAQGFFMWCTIMNGGLLIFTWVMGMCAAEWFSPIHSRVFSVSPETVRIVAYAFILLYKLFWLVFCVIPWLALLLVGWLG